MTPAYLRVLCYGYRDGMQAFARTWPAPLIIPVNKVLSECDESLLRTLDHSFNQRARDRGDDFGTLVLDIQAASIRGKAEGPVWHEEHEQFFQRLLERWREHHIVFLVPERRIADIEAVHVEGSPDVPRTLVDSCDVILRFTNAVKDDHLIPILWARCERHRLYPRLAGTLRAWDARTVIEGRAP